MQTCMYNDTTNTHPSHGKYTLTRKNTTAIYWTKYIEKHDETSSHWFSPFEGRDELLCGTESTDIHYRDHWLFKTIAPSAILCCGQSWGDSSFNDSDSDSDSSRRIRFRFRFRLHPSWLRFRLRFQHCFLWTTPIRFRLRFDSDSSAVESNSTYTKYLVKQPFMLETIKIRLVVRYGKLKHVGPWNLFIVIFPEQTIYIKLWMSEWI